MSDRITKATITQACDICQRANGQDVYVQYHSNPDFETYECVDTHACNIAAAKLGPIVTGTDMLIDSGVCPECFSAKHLFWFAEAPINGVMQEGVIYCTDPAFTSDGVQTAWVGSYIAPAIICEHGNDRSEYPCDICDPAPEYCCHICGKAGSPDEQLTTDDGDGCLFICAACESARPNI